MSNIIKKLFGIHSPSKTFDETYKSTMCSVMIPETGIGDLSDGYHTFNELYHHRAVLFSVICNMLPHRAWKSKLHHTGDMYDGMFIVGIETPEGQATYHYDIEPYWDMFKVVEVERAPEWDGHTPEEAINRISKLCCDPSEIKRYDMHDDDVVKALKCCSSDTGSCVGCPLNQVQMCGRELELNALNLIERQKNELDKLRVIKSLVDDDSVDEAYEAWKDNYLKPMTKIDLFKEIPLLTCPLCGGKADFVSGRRIECKDCGAKFEVENIIGNIELKGESK